MFSVSIAGRRRGRRFSTGQPRSRRARAAWRRQGVRTRGTSAAVATSSVPCGPEVLCGLKSNCSPNAAICCLSGFPRVCWCSVVPSPPTQNVVSVQAACRTSHFKIELSSPIVAPTCRSVKSLIAPVCPWIFWSARSMPPLELLSPTGLSS